MRIEVKTRFHKTRAGEPRLVLDFMLTPRGSGNKAAAERLAKEARESALASHLTRVVVGASRVTLHLRSDLELLGILASWPASGDVSGQLMLPGILA